MLNSTYHFEKMREVLDEYEPSRELSLAKTKLDECQLWLTQCRPTEEALNRDQRSPNPEEAQYTSHGWHIPGTPEDSRHFILRQKCGGPDACIPCREEVFRVQEALSTGTLESLPRRRPIIDNNPD
jgi:hypothetical protein